MNSFIDKRIIRLNSLNEHDLCKGSYNTEEKVDVLDTDTFDNG